MATVKTTGRRFKPPLRFRLRTILFVISAISLLCGWQIERLHRRARAGELINHWGLWVAQEWPARRGPLWGMIPDSARPRLLQWRTPCIGVAGGPFTTDEWIDYGRRMARHRFLWSGTWSPTESVSNASSAQRKQLVAAIAEFTELRLLSLHIPLDDGDLRVLSHLEGLEYLSLRASRLSEAGLTSVQKFRKLISLEIFFDEHDSIPIETVTALGKLPRLEHLYVWPDSDERSAQLSAALPRVGVNRPFWGAEPAIVGR